MRALSGTSASFCPADQDEMAAKATTLQTSAKAHQGILCSCSTPASELCQIIAAKVSTCMLGFAVCALPEAACGQRYNLHMPVSPHLCTCSRTFHRKQLAAEAAQRTHQVQRSGSPSCFSTDRDWLLRTFGRSSLGRAFFSRIWTVLPFSVSSTASTTLSICETPAERHSVLQCAPLQ